MMNNLYGRPFVGAPPHVDAGRDRGAPTEGRPYRFIIFTLTNYQKPETRNSKSAR